MLSMPGLPVPVLPVMGKLIRHGCPVGNIERARSSQEYDSRVVGP